MSALRFRVKQDVREGGRLVEQVLEDNLATFQRAAKVLDGYLSEAAEDADIYIEQYTQFRGYRYEKN